MKFEGTEVWGFEHALRAMRNPYDSWHKSDSDFICVNKKGVINGDSPLMTYLIGTNDLKLAQKLIKAGSEHRKFLRQIFVCVDITAPLYWWKEFDTYKVGIVSNSCSTMHKLASTPITRECFEMDDFSGNDNLVEYWEDVIVYLEGIRQVYNETKDKRYWKELIRLLPESYLQKRTITMNYENILSMVKQRKNHKLTEWSVKFVEWVKSLPYANKLIFIGEENGEC